MGKKERAGKVSELVEPRRPCPAGGDTGSEDHTGHSQRHYPGPGFHSDHPQMLSDPPGKCEVAASFVVPGSGGHLKTWVSECEGCEAEE